jgi:hypothetical protein
MQLRMLTLPVTDGWAVAEIRWIPVRGHTFPVFYFFIEESEIGSGVLLNRDCRRRVELNRADFTSETPGCNGLTLRSLESFCNNKDARQLFTQKNNWPLFNTLTINSVFFYSPWYSFSAFCHSQYFYYRLAKSLTVQQSLCENPLQCLPRLFNSFPLSTAHPNNRLLNRCVLNLPLNRRPKHPPCQLASCHP